MVNKKKVILPTVLTIGAAIVIATSCGKKSSDDDTSTASNPVESNPSAVAYPTSLALSAFPQSSTTLAETDASDKPPREKKEEQDKILKGEGDSCVPKVMDQKDAPPTSNTCYEFDQDMVYGSKTNSKGTDTKGTTDGKDSNKEACLVGFARANVKRIVSQVDRSLALAQMALCQKKKDDGAAVPAVDQEVDLKSALAKGMPKGTVTSAKMKRLADAADGSKVFTMTFDISRQDGVPMTVNIVHSPKNDANTSYTGVVYTKVLEKDAAGASASKTRMISVMYDRTDTKIKYSMRSANFASSLVASAIGSDGQVDPNAGATFTGSSSDPTYGSYTGFASSNEAVDGITMVQFEGNPTTNAGTFAYWQNPGSNYGERARGLVASVNYDENTKLLSGCAMSGAAGSSTALTSIRAVVKEGKTLEPNGAYHPFFNNGTDQGSCAATTTGSDTTGTFYQKVCGSETRKWYVPTEAGANGVTFVTEQMPAFQTKQCFKQNATSQLYEIDSSVTTGKAGFDLISATDTTKRIPPPGAPEPGKGVAKK